VISSADGGWRVRDLGSLNGTRVNGERLDAEWELSARDELHLGRQQPDLPRADQAAERVLVVILRVRGGSLLRRQVHDLPVIPKKLRLRCT